MIRLFAAIKVEPSTNFLKQFRMLNGLLKHEKIKWVEEHNFHFTLKFFGETDPDRIPSITDALDAAAKKSEKFHLQISSTGIFGSRYKPRVVWFGIEPERLLIKLHENIDGELLKAGWPPDPGNFIPHLTLGRIKRIDDLRFFHKTIENFSNAVIQRSLIDKIILYESILKQDSPEYIVIKEFSLL